MTQSIIYDKIEKYIKQLIKLINYERDAEIELMTNEIKICLQRKENH